LADTWRHGRAISWVRVSGGLMLVLAGVWFIVAGPLFQRLWLDIIGVVMLVLGGYLARLGLTVLRHLE
jgi:hypothetical protein